MQSVAANRQQYQQSTKSASLSKNMQRQQHRLEQLTDQLPSSSVQVKLYTLLNSQGISSAATDYCTANVNSSVSLPSESFCLCETDVVESSDEDDDQSSDDVAIQDDRFVVNDSDHVVAPTQKSTFTKHMDTVDSNSPENILEQQQQIVDNNNKTSLFQCFHNLLQRRELYKGVGPLAITLATSSFVFFYVHEYLKRQIFDLTSSDFNHDEFATSTYKRSLLLSVLLSSPSTLSLLASCVAGIINVVITNPLWVANLRIVTGETKNTSLLRELLYIAKVQGIKQLWKGTWSSILLVSNPVIQFYCYEQLKNWQLHQQQNYCTDMGSGSFNSNNNNNGSLQPLQAFVTGALAKAIATVLTYPLQLTQAILRLQHSRQYDKVNNSNSNEINENDDFDQHQQQENQQRENYRGVVDCLVKVYRRDGLEGLFTGMRAKLLQTVLTAAFTFLTYEQILQAVHKALLASQRTHLPKSF